MGSVNESLITAGEVDIPNDDRLLYLLGQRIGHSDLKRRLRLERAKERWFVGEDSPLAALENWRPIRTAIRTALRWTKLLERAQVNALSIQVRRQTMIVPRLPAEFDGLRILHLSDLHLDMNDSFPQALSERVRKLSYDLCVITGDFRFETFGPVDRALDGMRRLRVHLPDPVYGVLGNHDSIRMVPQFEALGVKMLVNESVVLRRGKASVHLAGVDDAHYYRAHNFDAVSHQVRDAQVSILLAHTPEVYAEAARRGFDLMFCGHTHGGQICLPGGFPLITEARCPRRYTRGYWQHAQLQGYTSAGAGSSVVDLRLNCPPEVTVHTLRRA